MNSHLVDKSLNITRLFGTIYIHIGTYKPFGLRSFFGTLNSSPDGLIWMVYEFFELTVLGLDRVLH